MWGVTSFGDELTGDFCDGFEAISIGDFGLFYRLAGKIVSRILGLLQQYRPKAAVSQPRSITCLGVDDKFELGR
jgi:hypothetical protein